MTTVDITNIRTRSYRHREAPRTMAVLQFIKAEIAAGREFPETKRINEYMGWRTGAHDALQRLYTRGCLERVKLWGPLHRRYRLVTRPFDET